MAQFDQRGQYNDKGQYNIGHNLYINHKPPRPGPIARLISIICFLIVVVILGTGPGLVDVPLPFIGGSSAYLSKYCHELESGALNEAYDEYSSGLKSQYSSSAFMKDWQSNIPSNCVTSISSTSGQTANGIVTMTIGYPSGSTIDYNTALIRENGVWKIDRMNRR